MEKGNWSYLIDQSVTDYDCKFYSLSYREGISLTTPLH